MNRSWEQMRADERRCHETMMPKDTSAATDDELQVGFAKVRACMAMLGWRSNDTD